MLFRSAVAGGRCRCGRRCFRRGRCGLCGRRRYGWRALHRGLGCRRWRGLSLRRRWCSGSRRLLGRARLRLVVGNDATDRRQDLLHRGLLDLRRLRHLRLHIETILHQAREDSPVPMMRAEIFIAPARLVPRSRPPEAILQASCRPMQRDHRWRRTCHHATPARRESPCCPTKRYVRPNIDCKQTRPFVVLINSEPQTWRDKR